MPDLQVQCLVKRDFQPVFTPDNMPRLLYISRRAPSDNAHPRLLHALGGVDGLLPQLLQDLVLKIAVEHPHDEHQAGRQHRQGHGGHGAKDLPRHRQTASPIL